MKVLKILTILFIVCLTQLNAFKSKKVCWWNICQDETKAFSQYYNSQTFENKQKLQTLITDCDNYSKKVRKECEKNHGFTSFNHDSFIKFYECINICNDYHVNKDTCRDKDEHCQSCIYSKSCITYKKQNYSFEYDVDNQCVKPGQARCSDDLYEIAQLSCFEAAYAYCQYLYMDKYAKSDDPCRPCFSSMISPLIILLVLLCGFYS